MKEGSAVYPGESSSPRRIAMVIPQGYVASRPPIALPDTGSEILYVLALSRQLARRGHEVDIWTRQFEEQPALEVVSDRIRIRRVPCGGSAFIPRQQLHASLEEWVERAYPLLASERPAYAVVSSHYWDGGLAGRALAARLGVAHVHTPHSLGKSEEASRADAREDPGEPVSGSAPAVRIACEAQTARDADLVVALTADQERLLELEYGVRPGSIRVIPPGYDDARYYPVGECAKRALRARVEEHGKVVLALGRLSSRKGYDLLLRAFAEASARDTDVRLHLAISSAEVYSGGSRLADTRALARRLGLGSRVTFSGYVSDAEIADLYRSADVFVLPSRYSVFGTAALGALACGTPLVMSHRVGLARFLRVGLDALCADPFVPAEFASALLAPLRNPRLAQRLSRNGAQTARDLFTWTRVAAEWTAALEELLARSEGFEVRT